ncbi:MAG: TetR/AcrR family transcriptional regulator [Methylobacteriaceae bacterium]|nr:TetR/AcrR family transcriptional regulator [Methylobacteriaceae bacterium]
MTGPDAPPTPTERRREAQRAALFDAAERAIAAQGLEALTARDLARGIGVALGAIYNLVEDMDEIVLRVAARTLDRLDAALEAAAAAAARDRPCERLVAIALAYRRFAAENELLWRALFDFRRGAGRPIPDWAASGQLRLFRHIAEPLQALAPERGEAERAVTSATLFSAVHGVVWLAFQKRLVAVPEERLDDELASLVTNICRGMGAAALTPAPARPARR